MAHSGRVRILLVDDEGTYARTFSRALRRLEPLWQIDYVTTPEEGIDRATKKSYDCIAVDWNLGHDSLTGLDICRKVRENGISAVLAMLTFRADIDDRVESILAGADEHIVKAVGFGEIRARIKVILTRQWRECASPNGNEPPRGTRRRAPDSRGWPLSLDLSEQEKILLTKLAETSHAWVKTKELALELGRRDDAGMTLVWQLMRNLRKKIRRHGLRIESRRGRGGYRLVRTRARAVAVA